MVQLDKAFVVQALEGIINVAITVYCRRLRRCFIEVWNYGWFVGRYHKALWAGYVKPIYLNRQPPQTKSRRFHSSKERPTD